MATYVTIRETHATRTTTLHAERLHVLDRFIRVGDRVRRIGDTFRHAYTVVALRRVTVEQRKGHWGYWSTDVEVTNATIRTQGGRDRVVDAETLRAAGMPWSVSDVYRLRSNRALRRRTREQALRSSLLAELDHAADLAEAARGYRSGIRAMATLSLSIADHSMQHRYRASARSFGLPLDTVMADVERVRAGLPADQITTIPSKALGY